LPRSIGTSGKGWLIALAALAAWVVVNLVSSWGRRMTDAVDSAVLRVLSRLRTGWLTEVFRGVDRVATGWTMFAIALALLASMVVFRRCSSSDARYRRARSATSAMTAPIAVATATAVAAVGESRISGSLRTKGGRWQLIRGRARRREGLMTAPAVGVPTAGLRRTMTWEPTLDRSG